MKKIICLLSIFFMLSGCKPNTTYTVTYKNDDVSKTITVEKDEKIEKPDDPIKEGYLFIGWYDEEGKPYAFDQYLDKNIVLIAKYEEDMTAGDFLMAIEDALAITGRGLVVSGRIERGQISVGDDIEIVGMTETKKSKVLGIENFREQKQTAKAGENIGILLEGISRDEIEFGQVVVAVGTMSSHTSFTASIQMLSLEEGGSDKEIASGDTCQWFFRTVDIDGTIEITKSITAGDSATATIQLEIPIALEEGTEFALRDNGKTIGAGKIIDILK